MATSIDSQLVEEGSLDAAAVSFRREMREPLDASIRLVTPERIRFRYHLAGPFRRATAYLIDLLAWIALLALGWLVMVLLSVFSVTDEKGFGSGLILVFYFVLQWGYGAFCEAVFNGRTLGKRLAGIRVVSTDGVPIAAGQAVLRNLLWTLEWALPLGYLPAIASMLLTRRFQRLGDLAAKTMVVVERRDRQHIFAAIRDPAILKIMESLPARIVAGPELSRGLGEYVKRRRSDTKARREEIAGRLAFELKERYGLPLEASNDAVLCAFYNRVFWGDRVHGVNDRRSPRSA